MKSSIRKQFAWIFIGLMAGVVLLCSLVNTLFLEQYYISSKQDVIYTAYETICYAANGDSYDSAEFVRKLNDVCSKSNITVCVMDANSQKKYASVNGGEQLELRLLGYIFGRPVVDEVTIIEDSEEYRLQRIGISDKEYLEMYGRLNSGISFIMQTPIESIRESAALANRFFFYVGLLGTVAGGIIIWFVSGKITGPILKLSDISQRMVHLDFDAEYQGKAGNEIDLLGENINKLSRSLEEAISELKTANNELQKDVEKKERIDEMRKEFLSNVSHELKTPIALIQGYAEGLKEGISDNQESREFYCEVIMDEASKMNSMVKKLLSLNQLEFGNDVISMERFDIVGMIQNCLQSGAILLKQNQITVRMEKYPPVYVWADEFKVEEVFMNYFSNAINHCSNERYMEIRLIRKEQKVRVCVFNSGEPIPKESLEFIWDKFYKVDKARTREYGGSGVGLSIVKAIMEALNQNYGVENQENGVMFWFELESCEGNENA
ncbi:MAG: HAMP domain-containing histidine kinase [Roseburia sp.]|nr:HAMP domain-containing histidine kinase [Roseburia sp.]